MKSIISVVNDSLIETEQKQNSLEDSYDYLRHEVQIQKLAQGTIKLETAIIEKITSFMGKRGRGGARTVHTVYQLT